MKWLVALVSVLFFSAAFAATTLSTPKQHPADTVETLAAWQGYVEVCLAAVPLTQCDSYLTRTTFKSRDECLRVVTEHSRRLEHSNAQIITRTRCFALPMA